MNKLKLITYLVCFFLTGIAWSQEFPPIINFSAEEYNAENQNWGISQSDNKNIYVANNLGLLEYNGAKWTLYDSPNNSVIRSVNAIDDRIYTGCYMEFGYWEKNEFNSLTYHSLSFNIKETLLEEEQFWNIVSYDHWILFQSLHRIYIYDTIAKRYSIITSKTNLPRVIKVNETIYFQKISEGLFKLENGEPKLVSDHSILKSKLIVNIYPAEEGIDIQTANDGLFNFVNNSIRKRISFSDDELTKATVFSSLKIDDTGFLLGTISKGIYIVDFNGTVLTHIDQKSGLNNNTVLSVFEDIDKNLWLGLDNGISVVNYKSPIKVFDDVNGALGTVYAAEIFNDKLFIGTNQGLFYRGLHKNEGYTFVEGTGGQVWCLKQIDNALFCGHNVGTIVIDDNNRATQISSEMGTWDIKKIPGYPNLLMKGNYEGIHLLEFKDGNWDYRNKLEGFDISSRFFEIIDNTIFVSHERKGVYKLRFDEDLYNIKSVVKDPSAPISMTASIILYNNDLLYFYNEGVLKYDRSANRFKKDSILTKVILGDSEYYSGKLKLDTKSETLWSFSGSYLNKISPGKLNLIPRVNKIPFPISFRKINLGFEEIKNIGEDNYLVGSSNGYVIFNESSFKKQKNELRLDNVTKSDINGIINPVSLNNEVILPSNENNLTFEFNVPIFSKFDEVKYRYKLDGFQKDWSNWSKTSTANFKNLNYGSYTFLIEAIVGNEPTNNVEFDFRIERPFYLSNIMITVYALLFLFVLITIHLLNKSYYKKQKRRLLEQKQKELSFFQLENDKVVMKLKNDKLRSEVSSKSRELAASTMSIIKKNEVLNKLKKELGNINNVSEVKKIIKSINNSLANNNDWEFFQEAFNSTDRDFLKKIKLLHPDLTPNDLKLSTYLRLNLSTKEIAPLLNISMRSVETRRYRLRKKMELEKEKGLVEYIMEI